MQNRLLLFVSLFTLSAIGLLFWRFRSKQLKRKELLEKNLELERLNAELGAAQLENQKLLNQELNEELNYKKGDLTNLSIDISRRNDFTLKVIELIKKLDIGASNEGQIQKRELIMFLSHQKSIDSNLKDIQTNMDIVNQEFVSKLSDKHPELTKTDIQICSLYRIGLNSKDISALKGISPKSVEMSRYRLRKKLALTPEMDLIKFLQEY
jgi:DNA-binding CsgD family transcriptional regulator